jgi:hypothetical protein
MEKYKINVKFIEYHVEGLARDMRNLVENDPSLFESGNKNIFKLERILRDMTIIQHLIGGIMKDMEPWDLEKFLRLGYCNLKIIDVTLYLHDRIRNQEPGNPNEGNGSQIH